MFSLPYWHDGPTYCDVHIHTPLIQDPPLRHVDAQLVANCKFVYIGVSQYWPVYKLEQVHVNETLVELELIEQEPPFRHIALKHGLSNEHWNILKSRTKKTDLLNPQNVPVYCAGQTHTPLTHGLLEKKKSRFDQNLNIKKKIITHPFIHNPLHGLSNDVSHLVPVYGPTQTHVNQVFVVFQ